MLPSHASGNVNSMKHELDAIHLQMTSIPHAMPWTYIYTHNMPIVEYYTIVEYLEECMTSIIFKVDE